MIYFVLAALALGFVQAERSAVLELTGDAPKVHFGELGGSEVLTLIHSPAEEKLTCSGTFEASDVRIAGTSTTVAAMMAEVFALRHAVCSSHGTWSASNLTCSCDSGWSGLACDTTFTPYDNAIISGDMTGPNREAVLPSLFWAQNASARATVSLESTLR